MGRDANKPYKTLGSRLKKVRESHNESLAEVSGAVEIESDTLQQFELGVMRPSEEILLLLISHFDLEDKEATQIWDLAGYDKKTNNDNFSNEGIDEHMKQVAVVMPMDVRIVYTDIVNVMVNNYGVVMNFMQNAGPGNQPLAVARVGMSKEHAQSVLEVLQQTLAQAEKEQAPKILPSPKTKKEKSDKNG